MKEIKIISVSYCPGYGDMRGEYHEMSLRKDKEGNSGGGTAYPLCGHDQSNAETDPDRSGGS